MIPILFEDQDIIVVRKPYNMPCQKDFSRTPDMLSETEKYMGHKAFLIHRLDRHVSGPVLVAKNKRASSMLNKQLQTQGFTKRYLAVSSYSPNLRPQTGPDLEMNTELIRLNQYIKKEKTVAKVIDSEAYKLLHEEERSLYKPCSLSYRITNHAKLKEDIAVLLDVDLITGRFHQIRAQLAYQGLGILGDPKYGNQTIGGQEFKKIGLQCVYLGFKHPVSHKAIEVSCKHDDGPFKIFEKV